MRVLLDYPWQGNIRELHNVVEYAFAVGRGMTLRLSELPLEFNEPRIVNQQIRQSVPLSADEETAAIHPPSIGAKQGYGHGSCALTGNELGNFLA